MKTISLPLALACALGAAGAASAQDEGNGITFKLGAGPQSAPEYFGAEDNEVRPTGSFSLERLKIGDRVVGGGNNTGLGFGGSFRFISERDSDEYEELTGLEDIDAAVEIGGGLRFAQPGYNLFANLRYGVVGHESLVGEIGGNVVYRPSDQITLSAGPRIFWGSDDYAQTYFGVEEATDNFDAFDAGGGILSQGVQAQATYDFNEDWGVQGTIRYDQLRDDAEDSPITQSEEQVTGSIVLTRRITFGF